jgi:Fe-S-cluster containining protein
MEKNQQFWERFTCHRCGKCCTQLGLPYDARALPGMADFLGIGIDELVQKYYGHRSEDGQQLVSEDRKRKPCPFLVTEGHKKACGIYPVRPEGCRAFPFDTDFGTNGVPCPAAKEVYVSLGIQHRRV